MKLFGLITAILLLSCNNFLIGKKIGISLGGSCSPAGQLRTLIERHYGIRDQAFPFDWLISPFEAVYKCLEDDFNNFLNPACLEIYQHQGPGWTGVLNTCYGLKFIHDFPTNNHPTAWSEDDAAFDGAVISNFLNQLYVVQAKYERRIKRFREVLAGDNEIVFIRSMATKEQSIRLYNLIKSRYPNLNFTLIVADSTGEIMQPWGIPGIKNMYVPDIYAIGTNQWKHILQEVGLLPI